MLKVAKASSKSIIDTPLCVAGARKNDHVEDACPNRFLGKDERFIYVPFFRIDIFRRRDTLSICFIIFLLQACTFLKHYIGFLEARHLHLS